MLRESGQSDPHSFQLPTCASKRTAFKHVTHTRPAVFARQREFLTAAACVSDVTRAESVAGVFPGNYAEQIRYLDVWWRPRGEGETRRVIRPVVPVASFDLARSSPNKCPLRSSRSPFARVDVFGGGEGSRNGGRGGGISRWMRSGGGERGRRGDDAPFRGTQGPRRVTNCNHGQQSATDALPNSALRWEALFFADREAALSRLHIDSSTHFIWIRSFQRSLGNFLEQVQFDETLGQNSFFFTLLVIPDGKEEIFPFLIIYSDTIFLFYHRS